MVNEYARRGRGGSATTQLMTGYQVGAVLNAPIGILVITPRGWRCMFVVGAAPALVLVPLLVRYLAESDAFLAHRASVQAEAKGSEATDGAPARDRPAGDLLLGAGLTRSTLAFLGDLVHGAAAAGPRAAQAASDPVLVPRTRDGRN